MIMREVKFRAKRVDNGEWTCGGVIVCDDYCIIDQGHEVFVDEEYEHNGDTHYFSVAGVMCDEKTIGQFTGLHDKNGKEIYEGDIVLQQGYNGKKTPMVVRFEHGSFIVGYHEGSSTKRKPMLLNYQCEVIGNIHDNPNLMED